MRPRHLNGFTLGSILRQNTRLNLFGDIPPLAQDECEKDKGTTIYIAKENKRREQALRERLQHCRKILEGTNWSDGAHFLSKDRAMQALKQLELAEKTYRDLFKRFEGDKATSGHRCIFFHANIYEHVLNQLWQAELKAGILPPVAQDECAEKKDPRLSVHQGAEHDVRNRLKAARDKLYSVDWKLAGMVAEDLAKKAVKLLERAEQETWNQFRHHVGWKPEGPTCIYAIYYKHLQPFIIKAEDAIDEAVGKAGTAAKAKQMSLAEKQARVAQLQKQLAPKPGLGPGMTPGLGPIVRRPQAGGLFGWLQKIFGF